jgi:NADPH2:quinone reductase
MRAAWVERVGDAPGIRKVPDPMRGDGEALIEVKAAAINPVDLSIAAGRYYAGAPEVPYVPGKEGVGVVKAGHLLPAGKAYWFETRGGLGGPGSFAELVSVEEDRTIEVPYGLDGPTAASIGIAGLTAWLALEYRASLGPGECVLVLGASGAVGRFAIQAAKLMGAGRVIAAARDQRGLARAAELGADATVNLALERDLPKALRDAAETDIDVVVDPLWGVPATEAMEAVGYRARFVNLGQSAAPEASLRSASVRGKLLDVMGFALAAVPHDVKASAYTLMAAHVAEGRLIADHETVPLSAVGDAWERQASFPHRKLILVP